MGGCCSGGESYDDEFAGGEEWAQWDKHPARQHYDVFDEIGEGAFSKVVRGKSKATGEEVALKVVHRLRPGVKPHHWQILHGEKETLNELRHPNIIDLKDSYEDDNQLVMVLEMLQGGELLEHLKSVKFYKEQKAAQLFRQIASAVQFMHESGYLHRDLKPENVLFVQRPTESPKDELTLKLIDMGMATKHNPSHPVRGAMGTAGFLAPECCHRVPHSPSMDIWSLGMLLFTMLTGRMPYSHSQIERLQYPEIPITKSPGVQSQRFLNLSKHAQELLLGMLQHDPIVRMSAAEVMQHEWVITEGMAKRDKAAAFQADHKKTGKRAKFSDEGSDRGEISTELKASTSRKNLKQIQLQSQKSSKSLKNLFAGSGPKEAELTKSKSRFEILDDRQLRSRSKKSMKNNSQGASVAKGKSFFGTLDSDEEDEDEDEEEEEKPGLTGSKSGSGGMKKNKVSPAY